MKLPVHKSKAILTFVAVERKILVTTFSMCCVDLQRSIYSICDSIKYLEGYFCDLYNLVKVLLERARSLASHNPPKFGTGRVIKDYFIPLLAIDAATSLLNCEVSLKKCIEFVFYFKNHNVW